MRSIVLLLLLTSITPLYSQEIALTFDDAPTPGAAVMSGPERTRRIIEHLKANGVEEAAFFVITSQIDQAGRERLNKYVKAGHVLANHTHRHQWIHQLGVSTYCQDIAVADSILKTFGSAYRPWFRYPFLDEGRPAPRRDSIRNTLKELGLVNGYVTIDNYDWFLNGLYRDAIVNNKKVDEDKFKKIYLDHVMNSIRFYDDVAKKVLNHSPRHVLLLHENDLAAKYLGELIKLIRSEGWQIISPTEAFKDPIANQIPDVVFNNQGRVAAIAREKGIPARELIQDSEDEEHLKQLVTASGAIQ